MFFLNILLLMTLIFIAVDDWLNFRIKNEAIIILVVILLSKFFLGGFVNEPQNRFICLILMVLLVLMLYYFRAFGGGDAKLIIISFFGLNMDHWYSYFCYLSIITLIYSFLAFLKIIPQHKTVRGTRIPLGPCICLAWAINIMIL